MSTGDEVAIRVLGAVLGRPGWQDETPRMMVGTALRQRRGHWDSTTANAWGAVVARRFASLYPASAISGPSTDHVVVFVIGLPWTAPNPCNAKSKPNSATTMPSAMTAVRMALTLDLMRTQRPRL